MLRDWYWIDADGNEVAQTDLEFIEIIMPGLMNRFNEEAWDLLYTWLVLVRREGLSFYIINSDFV